MAPYSTIHAYLTARDTAHRLTPQPDLHLGQPGEPVGLSVIVDPDITFQEIEGFGGAFTEAAALTLFKLPAEQQAAILRAYFDPVNGLGYTLCRTHINSCDFSSGNYAYDEVAGDTELAHFSIDCDRRSLIPMIKAAQQVAPEPIKLLASPWSPPAWMKTNGDMCHGGKLKPEYHATWAAYLCRYVQEYAREGIPMWGLTLQNEPMAVQTWESCIYLPDEARDYVRDYLGPALAENHLENIRLLTWDHNRDQMVEWIKPTMDDPQAAKYLWGTAFHWYVTDRFENVQIAHELYPDKKLLFTEGCQEDPKYIGQWSVGERYGRSMINDLNHWAAGWIDWNMVLDETGGPNHVGNLCCAPVIADTRSGEFQLESSYYYVGHISRFVRPGARRVLCATSHDDLEAAAFVNPDGTLVVVALNLTDRPLSYRLKLGGVEAAVESLPHSIETFVAG